MKTILWRAYVSNGPNCGIPTSHLSAADVFSNKIRVTVRMTIDKHRGQCCREFIVHRGRGSCSTKHLTHFWPKSRYWLAISVQYRLLMAARQIHHFGRRFGIYLRLFHVSPQPITTDNLFFLHQKILYLKSFIPLVTKSNYIFSYNDRCHAVETGETNAQTLRE